MRYLSMMFSQGIPAYFWLGVLYGVFVLYVATIGGSTATVDGVAEVVPLYLMVEQDLTEKIFGITLFSGNEFAVTGTVIFIVLGFLSAWVEVVRATNVRSTARNDTWSLIVTLIAFILFVGISEFGTTAFLIVAVVGFGDILLDRYVGQAVARRDFGFPGAGGGGGGG
ncbi:MAG: hypothetical protein AAF909_08790 [Pseudomonadota bacterium]